MKTGRGTAFRTHIIHTRFAPIGPGGHPPLDLNVAKLREFLRTDQSLAQIAEHFGVSSEGLRNFIKRRNLCDLTERRRFIALQRSLTRDD